MNRIFFGTLMILCLLLVNTYPLWAQPNSTDSTFFKELRFRNPFTSALPKKEEDIIEPSLKPTPQQKQRPKPVTKPQPKPEPIVRPPQLDITGLVWNSDRPQAIVNDQVVDIGDTIEGSEIVNINREGITVKIKEKYFTINKKL